MCTMLLYSVVTYFFYFLHFFVNHRHTHRHTYKHNSTHACDAHDITAYPTNKNHKQIIIIYYFISNEQGKLSEFNPSSLRFSE